MDLELAGARALLEAYQHVVEVLDKLGFGTPEGRMSWMGHRWDALHDAVEAVPGRMSDVVVDDDCDVSEMTMSAWEMFIAEEPDGDGQPALRMTAKAQLEGARRAIERLQAEVRGYRDTQDEMQDELLDTKAALVAAESDREALTEALAEALPAGWSVMAQRRAEVDVDRVEMMAEVAEALEVDCGPIHDPRWAEYDEAVAACAGAWEAEHGEPVGGATGLYCLTSVQLALGGGSRWYPGVLDAVTVEFAQRSVPSTLVGEGVGADQSYFWVAARDLSALGSEAASHSKVFLEVRDDTVIPAPDEVVELVLTHLAERLYLCHTRLRAATPVED